jgi:RAD51-like protein 2
MANSLVDHVKSSAQRKAEAKRARDGPSASLADESLVPEWFNAEAILEGVHIFRVHDISSQTSTLYSLPRFLLEQERKGRPVKLLVIDSLAFHHRAAASANRSKNRSNRNNSLSHTYNLTRMATFLSELATEFEIAVVAMNHMTTRVDRKDTTGSGTKVVPALGESWAHSVTSRLIVDYYRRLNPGAPLTGDMRELRTCRLVKSPHKPPGTALFTITDKGIRSAPAQLSQMQQQQKRARLDD